MAIPKTALITGITGQDGSYLAELLLEQGYSVHGIVRRSALNDAPHKMVNLLPFKDRLQLHVVSFDHHLALYKLIETIKPDEVYHLAASSFVNYSFDDDSATFSINFNSTHCLLEALKECAPQCKLYFAGSSEMFGRAESAPQNEKTPFNPRSIYGISKLASHHLVKNYRDSYGLFACTGILYNHESPRRSFEFVTRKITSTAAKIKLGLEKTLLLGNLDAHRDWGYAPDYVKAMWLMLQQPTCGDYVIATGQTHSVRDFVECAFSYLKLDYREWVEYDERFFRATEKVPLVGESTKAREKLGWRNTKGLDAIVAEMVEHDLKLLEKGPVCA